MKRKRTLIIILCAVLLACMVPVYFLLGPSSRNTEQDTETTEIEIPVSQPPQGANPGNDTGNGDQGATDTLPAGSSQGSSDTTPVESNQGGSGSTAAQPQGTGGTQPGPSPDEADTGNSGDIVVNENGDILLPELP